MEESLGREEEETRERRGEEEEESHLFSRNQGESDNIQCILSELYQATVILSSWRAEIGASSPMEGLGS